MAIVDTKTPVVPISPIVPYLGGKRLLAKRLCAVIDRVPHTRYVEPFCGMGGVFLRRTSRPRSEVINDLNFDVANFFRIVRKHPAALVDELRNHLTCRHEFDRLLGTPAEVLTDIERAARFFYLQKCAYGGHVTGQTFGIRGDGRAGCFSADIAARYIDSVHARMRRVVIECLPYQDILRRYDHEHALFFLDPPYAGSEDSYGSGLFEARDFEALADLLASLRGRFVMSINDVPAIRKAFGRFHLTEVSTTYSVSTPGGQKARELIIQNDA